VRKADSLVPFSSVLALLNSNFDWTQRLGYAFADQQAAVMNSVQRLRVQAQAAGNLKATEQQIVRVEKADYRYGSGPTDRGVCPELQSYGRL
jgi:uncharacterized protein DUF3300